jgi:Zn-dependent protease with chaperone function
LEIYEAYWTSFQVLMASALAILALLALFVIFRRSENPRSRSRSLGAMMLLSIFFWLFIAFSFVVCFSFYETYETQPEVAIRTAVGVTLLIALLSALPLSYLLRRYSPQILLRKAKELSPPPAEVATSFRTLRRKLGVADAGLKVSKTKLPISFVAATSQPIVVISERLLTLLSKDEVEAVIAHELAHIKNSDTTLKAMVTAYRAALPHDPFIRLVGAAFHREREMVADQTAVNATGKPLSLASALLKIHRAFPKSNLRSHASLSILGASPTLLNRHPPITDRIEQLVRIAKANPRKLKR